jgi:recombination protein RecA
MNEVLKKSIIKDYGEIMFDLDTLENEDRAIVPVTLSLDIALNGGFQEGNVGVIAGVSGSGKTTLCLQIISQAQKMGKKCYYLDAECRLQPSMLKTIHALMPDPDKFVVIRSTQEKLLTAEDFFNIMISICKTETNAVIIIDSIASLCPENLQAIKLGESVRMATTATLTYAAMRQIAQAIVVNKNILIGITHIQANPGGYVPNEVGGNAWKFFSSYRITCVSSQETPANGDKKTGRLSEFKIYKTALGPGTGKGAFYIKYGQGYDRLTDLTTVAEEMGFISRAGAWYSAKLKSGDVKLQGMEKLCDHLREHPEDADELELQIRSFLFPKAAEKKGKK